MCGRHIWRPSHLSCITASFHECTKGSSGGSISNMNMQGWVSFMMEGIKFCSSQSKARIDFEFRFCCPCSSLPPSNSFLGKMPTVCGRQLWKPLHPSLLTVSFHECTKGFQVEAFPIWLCRVKSHIRCRESNPALSKVKRGSTLNSDSTAHAARSLPLIAS